MPIKNENTNIVDIETLITITSKNSIEAFLTRIAISTSMSGNINNIPSMFVIGYCAVITGVGGLT